MCNNYNDIKSVGYRRVEQDWGMTAFLNYNGGGGRVSLLIANPNEVFDSTRLKASCPIYEDKSDMWGISKR